MSSVSSAFQNALLMNNAKEVDELLSNGSIDVNAPVLYSNLPPLLLAASRFKKEVVQVLLKHGAQVDIVDNVNMTACHMAATVGNYEALRVLIAHGANLGLRNRDGESPLSCAVNKGREMSVLVLIEGGAPLDESSVICRAAGMNTAVAQALINRGTTLSSLRTFDGKTPCHIAALSSVEDPDLLQTLVNVGGVDLNLQTRQGLTCCHFAAMSTFSKRLRWLIDAGADFDVPDDNGRTPLSVACAHKHEEMILLLLAAGADALPGDWHRAAGKPTRIDATQRIIHLLVAAGMDLGATNELDVIVSRGFVVDASAVEAARRSLAKQRLDFVRHRALQVCIGLQPRGLDALQMCEILTHACGPVAPLIEFHRWWQIATKVKHFRKM